MTGTPIVPPIVGWQRAGKPSPGQGVALWKPRMEMVSTSAFTFVPHEIQPWVPPPPPPPRRHVAFTSTSSYSDDYCPKTIARVVIPPPPPRVIPPFYGASTSHTDFHAHPLAPRRPSIGIATACGLLHVLLPGGELPLPACGCVDLTTTQDGQQEMQLLVVEGDHSDAAHNRLLAELTVGGLPKGARRGDMRMQIRVRLDAAGGLEVEAESPDCMPQCRAWHIDTAQGGAAAGPC